MQAVKVIVKRYSSYSATVCAAIAFTDSGFPNV